jgi:GH43 family beta-xylosidase
MKRIVARLVALACVLPLLALPAQPATASTLFRGQLNGSADPTMTYHNGAYHLSTTLCDRISIWSSPTIAGLAGAAERVVFRDPDASRNKQVWAPSIHRFVRPEGPRWYIYYTASDGVDANHRNYVIESEGDDPRGPYHFKGRIADYGEYAIDGEPITHNGRTYFAWTGPGRGMGGPAQLYLRLMTSPWTTTGNRVALPADGGCHEVREGPTGLRGPGRLFLVYSACDTGKPDYQLWMKSIADGADPLVVANWRQHPGPVFARNDAAGVFGPGHNGFFRSPDGTQDWIVYHGKTSSAYTYDGRTTRAQPVVWNADGTPNFGRPVSLATAQAPPSGDPWSSQEPGASRGYVSGEQRHHFERSPDGMLAHWWREPADGSIHRDTWGGPIAGRPAGYPVSDEQHVFARTPEGILRHWWWAPGGSIRQEDWGSGLAGDPTGFVAPNGQKHIFGRGADGRLHHWWQEPTGVVRRDVWAGGDLVGNPVAYPFRDEQHVFARGSDNTLRHWFWHPRVANNLPVLDTWGATGKVHSDPTGFAFGDQQHVFYRAADGSVEHRFSSHDLNQVHTDNWGGAVVGAPYALRQGQTQQVFARAADGTLYRMSWRPGAAVTVDSGGAGATSDPVALAWRDETHVYTRGADGTLVDRHWQPAGGAVATSWGGQVAQ